jgi:hypothetical protein
MKTIYIVPIEPIDARYTKQWYENIPAILESEITKRNLDVKVVTVDGVSIPPNTTTGAFLDFGATNVYKASQAERISRMFSEGKIQPGDKFLVTDAWNFVITPIKYMSDLLDIPVEIHGIWHAGAYDPSDILGYKMNKPWPWHTERGWYHSCDYNYYATNFHKDMFLRNLNIEEDAYFKAVRSGQPHDPIIDQCGQYWNVAKTNTMIWPHRYNADKQPEIVEDLSSLIAGDTIITQKLNLSKDEYYKTLGGCSVMFSCSLHENLGISMMEGVLAGVIPIVPDRCSYKEMYLDEFKYPSEWTESVDAYKQHRDDLVEFVNRRINNRDQFIGALQRQKNILVQNYLNATVMIDKLLLNI